MAITNSDGSIIISTKVDTSGINQGASSIKGIIGKLGGVIAAAFGVKTIISFAKETKNLYKIQMQNEVKLATVMRQRMNATNEQIQKVMDLASAEQQLGIIGDEVQLAGLQQLATFAKQQETIESLLPAMNNLIAQQYGFEASAESARNVANLMGKVLQGQTGALTRVGITFTEAQEQVLKYGNESERAATLAQVITDNVGEMNKALAQTDIGRQQQLSNTIGDIKEQFGEAITQIEIFFLPLLQKLAEILSGIAVIFKSATNNLFNGGKENEAEWKSIENNSNKTAENIEEQVENQKNLNKEMKKTLAGFDEAQILSANAEENTSGSLDSELQGTGGDLGGNAPDGSAYVEKIDKTLTSIMGIVALSLTAVGLILLFTGNIGWGVGFIIAGAATLTVTMASASKFEYDGIIQMLTTIMGVAGGALLALGIILLWIGGIVGKGVAIGMIIAGGILIVSAIAAQAAFAPDDIAAWLSLIMGIAGGALLALGVILCMVGSLPLGVGMIIAGSVALVSAVALNFDSVKNSITGWVAAIMAIVGAAALVIGIVLCVTGVGIPLGIALIAAGAIGLVTPIALNWNAIVDWVKGAWEAVKGFWNKYIAPVFTAKFWTNLAKTCGNGLIIGFEAAINGIIWLFEGLINLVVGGLNLFIKGVSAVTGAIGDLIGVNLRIPEIPKASLGRVSIPRLAQGAVIPPNREFLAVLGDQKSGRNLEAPESLIRQIVREESGNASNITIKATGNMAQLIRLLKLELSQEDERATVF